MPEKIRVSVVSYLNSRPFYYGIINSEIQNEIELSLDNPAECAAKLISDKADIGLVPVAAIGRIPNAQIITSFCIATDNKVESVYLAAEVPLHKIKTVFLDYESLTSVELAKILAKKFWKISPQWEKANAGFENSVIGSAGALIIGDRALQQKHRYRFVYDLAEEWKNFTGLPFVFACWVSNKPVDGQILEKLNEALLYGVENINTWLKIIREQAHYGFDVETYLKQTIEFRLTDRHTKGLNLFLKLMEENT